MKDIFKSKIITILVVMSTIVLAGIAIFTALRLYKLKSQPVAPSVPESKPKATGGETISCTPITFTLTEISATPTPTTLLTPTEKPELSSTPTPTSSYQLGGPPECSATKPNPPTILSAVKTGSEALVTWTKVELATHYTISYGTNPGNHPYGVPNTGNVTSYTIKNLDSSKTYYFVVYAVNDCMPSDASTVKASTAGTSTELLPDAGVSFPTSLVILSGIFIIIGTFLLTLI